VLTGLFVWLIGLMLYMIPGFIVAIPMGINLGPKIKDNAEVGRLIGKAVAEMYQSALYIHYAYILALALLVLWRSHATSANSSLSPTIHGGLVAAIPLILTALPFGLGGHVLASVISVILIFPAGVIGARWKISRTSPPQS